MLVHNYYAAIRDAELDSMLRYSTLLYPTLLYSTLLYSTLRCAYFLQIITEYPSYHSFSRIPRKEEGKRKERKKNAMPNC